MSATPAFSNSVHLTASALVADNVLPTNTHICGNIKGWIDRTDTLKFFVRCNIPNDGSAVNDYALPNNSGTAECFVHIHLGIDPGSGALLSAVEKSVLKDARDVIESCGWSRDPVTLDVSGLKVVRYGRGDKGMKAELEGWSDKAGWRERMIRLPNGKMVQLFKSESSFNVSNA